MSKDRSRLGSEVRGELVGISKISSALYELKREIADEAFARNPRFNYETDCLVAAAAGRPIPCPLLADLVWGEIERVNTKFARVEQIKKFYLLQTQLTAEDDELTPTMKLKRKFVEAKYAEAIAAMYL
jgi:hypothetical protein